MTKPALSILAACLLATACTSGAQDADAPPLRQDAVSASPPAPEFSGISNWINSEPISMAKLRGKVVLVEFWTYDCINCIHVIPEVKKWHERYKNHGLSVVGVHTPEYAHERDPDNVASAVERFGITYPVGLDDEYATWTAYANRYWPALYLIDREGRIVYRHFGEGAYEKTEAEIKRLLAAL